VILPQSHPWWFPTSEIHADLQRFAVTVNRNPQPGQNIVPLTSIGSLQTISARGANNHRTRIFKDRREHTGRHQKCAALPAFQPYLRLSRFQGAARAVKKKSNYRIPTFLLIKIYYFFKYISWDNINRIAC
jgi:hypothetical protein